MISAHGLVCSVERGCHRKRQQDQEEQLHEHQRIPDDLLKHRLVSMLFPLRIQDEHQRRDLYVAGLWFDQVQDNNRYETQKTKKCQWICKRRPNPPISLIYPISPSLPQRTHRISERSSRTRSNLPRCACKSLSHLRNDRQAASYTLLSSSD
uniref:Uncharacterized protein n=1 Tax=Candidatus Methanogaster sp. ANME-2c ERB4 TaxID=2759911 RepID=A0A7G9YA95_9EURY|nr:hypothetical protein JHEBEADN_00005 [Methanosarcinales archaeon ANME-2c ERB4]